MVPRCSSIRREQCVHHPVCTESVTHRYDKVFLGTAQFLLRGALLTSRGVVVAIEATITGRNGRVRSWRRCCTRRRCATRRWGNSRRASTSDVAMTSCTISTSATASITHRSHFFEVCRSEEHTSELQSL